MQRSLFAILILCAITLGCGDGSTSGSPTPPGGKTDMPEFLQADFGQTGNLLPGDGLLYCGPVSVADLLVWLARNGYPELAPADGTEREILNLVRSLGGLFKTSAFGGTSGDEQEEGLRLYLGLKGFAPEQYDALLSGPTTEPRPGWEFFQRWNAGTSVIQVNPLWFDRSSTPTFDNSVGGHNVALIGIDEAAGTITISNPFPAGDPNPQTQRVSVVTAAESPDLEGLLQFDSDISGSKDLPIIEYAFGLRILRPPGEAAQPHSLSGVTAIDTNESTLAVLAPLAGDGHLQKLGPGVLDLVSSAPAAHSYRGGTTVSSGTIQTRSAGATPLGAGSLTVTTGALAFAPTGGGQAVRSSIAPESGADVTYGPGAALRFDLGAHGTVDLDLGGHRDGVTPNLRAQDEGTLVLAPSTGVLGDAVRVRVNGTGGNLPPLRNGIVLASIFLQAADENGSGGFLGYDLGAGFVVPAYSPTTDLQTAGENAVFDARDGAARQTIAGEVSVYALRVTEGAVGGDESSVLSLGDGIEGTAAGLILNGASITTGSLDFRSSRGIVYSSRAAGRIAAAIRGDAGLTVAGPGRLVLDGSSTYSGGTRVATGTLEVGPSASEGSATGGGPVHVLAGATLEGSGRIEGDVVVSADAVRTGASTISGTVTIDAGGTFSGGGEIQEPTQIDGTLSAIGDPTFMRFRSDVTFGDDAVLLWSLTNLTDAGVPGVDSSYFEVDGTLALGMGAVLLLNFAPGISPDQDLPFWKVGHEWRIVSANRINSGGSFGGLYQPEYRDGSFEWGTTSEGGRELLTLTYIPNDE